MDNPKKVTEYLSEDGSGRFCTLVSSEAKEFTAYKDTEHEQTRYQYHFQFEDGDIGYYNANVKTHEMLKQSEGVKLAIGQRVMNGNPYPRIIPADDITAKEEFPNLYQ